MENKNDNIEKVKSTVEETVKKVQESEALNKVKDTANNFTQRIKDNETVSEVVDKINQNEYVEKVKKSKYAKYIKIGAVILAVILIFNLFGVIFGDKGAKEAMKVMETEIISLTESDGVCTDCKVVKSKAIGKNEDAQLYAFDTTIKYKAYGESRTSTEFIIVDLSDDGAGIVAEYEYDKETKAMRKEMALGYLGRG